MRNTNQVNPSTQMRCHHPTPIVLIAVFAHRQRGIAVAEHKNLFKGYLTSCCRRGLFIGNPETGDRKNHTLGVIPFVVCCFVHITSAISGKGGMGKKYFSHSLQVPCKYVSLWYIFSAIFSIKRP